MKIEQTITINETQEINTTSDAMLSEILSRYAAYITVIPTICAQRSPLWVLINQSYIADADSYLIHAHPPQVVTTIEYALKFQYFQTCVQMLSANGIQVSNTNSALLVFTLFTWMKKNALERTTGEIARRIAYNEALIMTMHFPEHFNQPTAFTKVYSELLQLSITHPKLSPHHAFTHISSALTEPSNIPSQRVRI